jgi:Fe2+ transport system protein FeoA
VIVKIRGQSPFKRRLLEMGLVHGAFIRKIKLAPLADPAEFEIKDTHLSLRRAEAADVIVSLESPAAPGESSPR